jgi:methylthioribose-1-phosphate isomerase
VAPGESDETRIARLEEQMRAVGRTVDTFGPTAGQLVQTQAEVMNVAKELGEFKIWLREVEARLRQEIRDEAERRSKDTDRIEKSNAALVNQLQAGLTARIGARAMVTVGAFSAAAGIIAALISKGAL